MSKKSSQQDNRVGRGMKPRGQQQEAQPADSMKTGKSRCNCWCNGDPFKAPEQHAAECPESLESREKERSVSTDQVQAEGTKGVITDVSNEAETPTNQEADEAIHQALENPAIAGLAGMLRQSAGETEKAPEVKPNLEPEAVIEAIEKDEHDRHEIDYVGLYKRVGDEYVKIEGGIDLGQTLHPPYKPGENEQRSVLKVGAGLRPNNDFGVVITIPEYFVGSVKDFAEADGNKPVEQWCSEFFLMNLEAYCAPNKGR